MEYVEVDEDGGYGKLADGRWVLTPLGLAQWMDEEGGLQGLWQRNGPETFLEAGCNPEIVEQFGLAWDAMKSELDRIGAEL